MSLAPKSPIDSGILWNSKFQTIKVYITLCSRYASRLPVHVVVSQRLRNLYEDNSHRSIREYRHQMFEEGPHGHRKLSCRFRNPDRIPSSTIVLAEKPPNLRECSIVQYPLCILGLSYCAFVHQWGMQANESLARLSINFLVCSVRYLLHLDKNAYQHP